MIIETTDPVTGHDVKDLEHAPYILDGDLKIYFESEESKQEFLGIEVQNPGENFSHDLDNPAATGPGERRHR